MRFVSLGPTCETRWQLSRLTGVDPPHEGFDWQITDFSALMFCLHSNFRGAFDKDHLVVAHNCVRDRRFEAIYPHAFGGEPVAPDAIAIHYEAERHAFDRRTHRFREALKSCSTTFVRRENLSASRVRSLHGALRRLARRNVNLVVLGRYIAPERLPPGTRSIGFVSRFNYTERWQGDDFAWDATLGPLVNRDATQADQSRSSDRGPRCQI